MRAASVFCRSGAQIVNNAARCEGLSHIISFENIYGKYYNAFLPLLIPHKKGFHMIVHFLRYLISTVKQLLKVKFNNLNS